MNWNKIYLNQLHNERNNDSSYRICKNKKCQKVSFIKKVKIRVLLQLMRLQVSFGLFSGDVKVAINKLFIIISIATYSKFLYVEWEDYQSLIHYLIKNWSITMVEEGHFDPFKNVSISKCRYTLYNRLQMW